jgi:tetratricopeptide (TPR) repeat protein
MNKKPVEAKSFSLRATILAPGDAVAWVLLGESEKDLGEYAAAISHLNKAIDIDPLRRDALVSLFLCYEKIGDAQSAQEIWSRIAALGGPQLFG